MGDDGERQHAVRAARSGADRSVSRRALIAGTAALVAGGAGAGRLLGVGTSRPSGGQERAAPAPDTGAGAPPRPTGAAFIRAENAEPGSPDWTIPDGEDRPRGAEGFTDRVSAEAGERVRLFVRSGAATVTVVAYRTGHYGGIGAREIWRSSPTDVVSQPRATVDPRTRMVDCSHWRPTLTVDIDDRWPPGQYLFKLVPSRGSATFVPFVVRDDSRASDVLIVSDVTTAQAYNTWGGHSLYGDELGDPSRRATVVSFDRPHNRGWAQCGAVLGDTFNVGMLCESLGLDVSYTTNIDQHARPHRMARHKVIVSGAHDEYYSLEMRDGLESARDRGVNIVFLGANAVYRRIRLEDSPLGPHRRQVNYRSAAADPLEGDPARVTTSWREAPAARPESSLTGSYYESNEPGLSHPMVVVDADAWMFAGTNVTDGQEWPDLVREEYDRVTPTAPTPPSIQVLAHSPVVCRGEASWSDMTYYTTSSGAGVLNVGTLMFEPHLGPLGPPSGIAPTDPDQQIRRMMANVLTEFARGPAGRRHPAVPNLDRLGIRQPPAPRPSSDERGGASPTTDGPGAPPADPSVPPEEAPVSAAPDDARDPATPSG